MREAAAKVLGQQRIAADCMLLDVEAPEVVTRVVPGQFAQVRCGHTYDPLLRRPLSFHAVERDKGVISFLYQVRGKGTALLQEMSSGDDVALLGPLGKGFDLDLSQNKTAVLVAGGIGIAPLYQLALDLLQQETKVTVVYGAATKDDLYRTQVFGSLDIDLKLVTEDGSTGDKGLVTDPLQEILFEADAVYSCGPKAMLRQVALLADNCGVPCQVSLDTIMACGIGACLGCVTPLKDEKTDKGWRYERVCMEGPVFAAGEVHWND